MFAHYVATRIRYYLRKILDFGRILDKEQYDAFFVNATYGVNCHLM